MSHMRKAVAGRKKYASFVVDLSEFPAGDLVGKKDGIDLYSVDDDVYVLAYDDERCRTVPAKVSHWSVHTGREVVLVNLQNGMQIVTDDDPRAVYGLDPETWEMVRRRPSEAIGTHVPIVMRTVGDLAGDDVQAIHLEVGGNSKETTDRIILDRDSGYFLGALAGDGWISEARGVPRLVNFAVTDAGIRSRLMEIASHWRDGEVSEVVFGRDSESSSYGESARITFSSTPLAKAFLPLIGRGCASKHLPPFFLNAGDEFRFGLLEGLLDTDGTICICDKGSRKQTTAAFQSNSLRLAMEVQHLCRSLQVRSRITPSKTPAGEPCWVLSISWLDLAGLPLKPAHTEKSRIFRTAPPGNPEAGAAPRTQMIPVSKSLADAMRKALGRGTDELKRLYDVLFSSGKNRSISRLKAERILEKLPADFSHPHLDRFVKMVKDLGVSWDPVESFELTGQIEVGYDLTVPGFETFMSSEGIVLSNTMSFIVPVSRTAVQEAREKMFPEKNLISVGSGAPHYMPTQEPLEALYIMTKSPKRGKPVRRFVSKADMMAAYRAGEIDADDPVEITGDN